ncbi:hypothetical protein C7S17_3109 [Burkholderia thailandensis]|nr:hypothetical protein [Burkholderia thailandensis]
MAPQKYGIPLSDELISESSRFFGLACEAIFQRHHCNSYRYALA